MKPGFSDHFSALAAAYAAGRPSYPPALFAFLARAAPDRRRAWDCATGNGQAAAGLARHFEQVHATDASEQQLRKAAPLDNVQYTVQLAEGTDFPGDYFDAVTVGQAMHWFRIDEFGTEARRVLKPGGVLAAFTYGFFRITPAIDAVIGPEFFDPVEPYWPEEAAIAWSGYRDVDMPLEPLFTPAFAMVCDWSLPALTAYLASWSSLRYYTQARGPGLLEGLVRRLGPLWGDPAERRPVTMAFHVRAWRKTTGA